MTGIPCPSCKYFNLPVMNKCVMCKAEMPSDKEKIRVLYEQVQRLEAKLVEYVNAEEPTKVVESATVATTAPPSRKIFYNKREQYFTDPILSARRTNKAASHVAQVFGNHRQLSCVWCCRSKHNTSIAHSRHGFKTSIMCQECQVPLCQRDRFSSGATCFEEFHAAQVLNQPCAVTNIMESDMNITSGPVKNKRFAGQKVPKKRSKSGYILTTTPANSNSLKVNSTTRQENNIL
ncbi:hypothetical protein THRCLA_08045 [Thraustotheca clavata]|uniref:PiggyBac transposable element-derived protein 4 C-terminal zinc-finger domain-containing protein n=1 Tax=Thraustotheca clavata TaxID=74557 RepID=A0A1V9ZAF7_9STRA|nr:hypothetical protein THRCLA_08045 [Thraustotheca clavata]